MSFARYAQVAVAVAGTSLVLLWPLAPRLGAGGWTAAAWGAALAFLNSLAAYRLVLWSRYRSTAAFFRAILGGMLGRMALLLAAVAVALRAAALSPAPFVVSLLGHFVVLLVLETAVVSRAAAPTVAP